MKCAAMLANCGAANPRNESQHKVFGLRESPPAVVPEWENDVRWYKTQDVRLRQGTLSLKRAELVAQTEASVRFFLPYYSGIPGS